MERPRSARERKGVPLTWSTQRSRVPLSLASGSRAGGGMGGAQQRFFAAFLAWSGWRVVRLSPRVAKKTAPIVDPSELVDERARGRACAATWPGSSVAANVRPGRRHTLLGGVVGSAALYPRAPREEASTVSGGSHEEILA